MNDYLDHKTEVAPVKFGKLNPDFENKFEQFVSVLDHTVFHGQTEHTSAVRLAVAEKLLPIRKTHLYNSKNT